jgi:hypothetical protein
MANGNQPAPHQAQFMLYRSSDGALTIQALYLDGTIWVSDVRLAELFATQPQVIREHIQAIYDSHELDPEATRRVLRLAQAPADDGKEAYQEVTFYSLDTVIALSYRLNSPPAVQFRQWATATLRDLMLRGYTIQDERLEQGSHFGHDYLAELQAQVTDIRASEFRFYQRVARLYSTASDYGHDSNATRDFFRAVQNKLHYAAHGYTAPELIARRADARQPHMGLITWAAAPDGPIRKADVVIAKNYLTADELLALNRIVASFLDYAEQQATRHGPLTMADWAERLNGFLQFYEYGVLKEPSRITPHAANSIAEQEYRKYRQQAKELQK